MLKSLRQRLVNGCYYCRENYSECVTFILVLFRDDDRKKEEDNENGKHFKCESQ